jgi:TRAP transporter TAXI family solute receptor
MKSINLTGALTALALVTASPALAQDRSDWPSSFTVATASQGGTYFAYGNGWANLVADELGLSGGGEVSGGPYQNMALVHTGDVAFGMTTMGPARESIDGNNPIAPGVQMTNACAMFPMYQTPFSITALEGSGITSVDTIPDGAKIGFGPAGSTSDTYFPQMLEMLGVEFERRNGGWSDLGGQLQDGLLDTIAFAAGIPVPAVSQLEVQTGVNIIEFTEDEQKQIMEAFPLAARRLRPAGKLRLRGHQGGDERQPADGEHPPRRQIYGRGELRQEHLHDVAPGGRALVQRERRRHSRRHDPRRLIRAA